MKGRDFQSETLYLSGNSGHHPHTATTPPMSWGGIGAGGGCRMDKRTHHCRCHHVCCLQAKVAALKPTVAA